MKSKKLGGLAAMGARRHPREWTGLSHLWGGEGMLLLGEVHTGLLQHSTSLSSSQSERLLAFMRGERVRRFERPIGHVVSPELLTGVDCRLPTASGARVRAVGTIRYRTSLTGGHVLQGSSVVAVTRGRSGVRQPWSHYLARPGRVEVLGKADLADVAQGFVAVRPSGALLNLGAISQRVMDEVQALPQLDRSPPLRIGRTRMRWVAITDQDPPTGTNIPRGEVTYVVESGRLRTLRLRCGSHQAGAVAELCEDLALHDWLLSALLEVIERSQIGASSRAEVVERLRPAVEYLLHLWMPAARLAPTVTEFWSSLERRPGFTRQWQTTVDRIRDQLALSTIALLGVGAESGRVRQ